MSTAEQARTSTPPDGDLPAPPRRAIDRVSDALGGTVSSMVLGAGSAIRSARVFHPRGRTFRGTLRTEGAHLLSGSVLGRAGEHAVTVRFSRGTGFAEPLPDMLGLAMRVHDADGAGGWQDVLMLSSAPVVGGRHLILFRVGYGETFYSTIERLGIGERTVMLGARAAFDGPARALARLDELAAAIGEGGVRFDLWVTTALDTAWHSLGVLRLGEEVPAAQSEALRFTPFHRAGGLEPVGVVNALRRLGYEGSQRGRAS